MRNKRVTIEFIHKVDIDFIDFFILKMKFECNYDKIYGA